MYNPRLEIRKSAQSMGAEVFGLDLSEPLSDQQFQAVHDALMDNLVLFFRDQKLTIEQHKAFGSRFGKLHVHPAAPGLIPNHPEIFVIQADGKSTQVAAEASHSDLTCD